MVEVDSRQGVFRDDAGGEVRKQPAPRTSWILSREPGVGRKGEAECKLNARTNTVARWCAVGIGLTIKGPFTL